MYSQYSDTPLPEFQTNVTAEDVRVDPGAGLVICALVSLPPEAAVYV
jgi:hypothetical protein